MSEHDYMKTRLKDLYDREELSGRAWRLLATWVGEEATLGDLTPYSNLDLALRCRLTPGVGRHVYHEIADLGAGCGLFPRRPKRPTATRTAQTPLRHLLPHQLANRLRLYEIYTIEELTDYSEAELRTLRGLGPASVRHINEVLTTRKLALAADPVLPPETRRLECVVCGKSLDTPPDHVTGVDVEGAGCACKRCYDAAEECVRALLYHQNTMADRVRSDNAVVSLIRLLMIAGREARVRVRQHEARRHSSTKRSGLR